MAWSLALSLAQLKTELDLRWPNRDHASDGAIGDAAHAATASDHNPNAEGVVCAFDIDTDLDGTDDSNDPVMDAMVEWFRTHPHPNLKYVIYRGRIFSSYAARGVPPFQWRPYTGADPHTSHAHVSVGVGPDGQSAPGTYDDVTPWLNRFEDGVTDDMTPEQVDKLFKILGDFNTALFDPSTGITHRLDVLQADINALKAGGGASGTVNVSGQLQLG